MDEAVSDFIKIDEIVIAIDRDIVSETIINAMKKKQYEHVEARIGRALLSAETTSSGLRILEIGAGLGYVGSALFQSGKVEKIISYEANPKLIGLIRQTHARNGVNSVVFNVILTNTDEGSSRISMPADFWAASTVGATKDERAYVVKKRIVAKGH